MPKIGKRGKKRIAMNRQLDTQLKAMGISECEIRIHGVCVRRIMLSHAHSKKSRHIVTDADWLEAALCCIPCHEVIECKPEEEMGAIVRAAIAKRPTLTVTPFAYTVATEESIDFVKDVMNVLHRIEPKV